MIDDALAMTHSNEMKVGQLLTSQAAGSQGSKTRVAVVRQRGRRKDFFLDLAGDDIFLEGATN